MIRRFSQATHQILAKIDRVLLLILVTLVSAGPILIINQMVSAAQITSRSVNISSAIAGQTNVTYTFGFVPATASPIQSMKFQACTTAIGACTAPHGIHFNTGAFGALGGTWTNATNFAFDGTGANTCTPSASVLCANRTQAANETGAAIRTLSFTGITNQDQNALNCANAANCTFFVHVTTYSDTAYLTAVDSGTVASSTTQTFTVNAIIEEQLSFCIGSTIADSVAPPFTVPIATSCAAIAGTSLNLGILNSGFINVSPIPAGGATQGDANNGLIELSTNASNGTTVNYDAVQQSGTNHQGGLRVAGSVCNAGVVSNDQCVNSQGVVAGQFTAGTENFGMSVAGVDCQNISGYACTFATGVFHLVPTANYNCGGQVNGGSASTYTTDSGQIAGPSNCNYAWDETGTTEQMASSASAVGNEALILKFAATPNLITPTGSYTALADFVATPTY